MCMNHSFKHLNTLIVDIARLSMLRQACHVLSCKYSDSECYSEFIRRMNEKSKQFGLNHTKWINPSGLGESSSYSTTTARDLSLMAINANRNDVLKSIWAHKEALIRIRKPYVLQHVRFKYKTIQSTIPYERLNDKYIVLGAKTGSGDGYQTLVMICEIRHQIVAGAIMNASSEEDRFLAMSELMTIADTRLAESAASNSYVLNSAENACAYLVENGHAGKCLYEKNADVISAPMSTTKVMTILTALDYLHDLSEMIYVIPSDFVQCKSDILNPWERVSIHDLMYAAMLSSSNVAANALARITGSLLLSD